MIFYIKKRDYENICVLIQSHNYIFKLLSLKLQNNLIIVINIYKI
jgi:hypothetical protein